MTQRLAEGQVLTTAFTYLGITVSNLSKVNIEIESRIEKGIPAFGKLYKKPRNIHDVTIKTKVGIYKAIILTSLITGRVLDSLSLAYEPIERLPREVPEANMLYKTGR